MFVEAHPSLHQSEFILSMNSCKVYLRCFRVIELMLCAVVVALWWSVAVNNSWPTEDCPSQRQATLQWTFTSCCCLRCFRHSLLNSNVHAVKLGHQRKTLSSRTVARLLMCWGTLVAYQMHYLPQSSSIV